MSGGRLHCLIPYGRWRSVALRWVPVKSYTHDMFNLRNVLSWHSIPASAWPRGSDDRAEAPRPEELEAPDCVLCLFLAAGGGGGAS